MSATHSVGKGKAGFFRLFGFDETSSGLLENALLAIARQEEVREVLPSPHGTKYAIKGLLQTPTGRPVQVLTVWIIEPGQERPRFVTAYPA